MKNQVDPYYEVHFKINGLGWMGCGGYRDTKKEAEEYGKSVCDYQNHITEFKLKRRTTVDPIQL